MRRIINVSALLLLLSACGNSAYVSPQLTSLLADSIVSCSYDSPGVEPPDGGCQRVRTYPPQGLGRSFNDKNDVHIFHALSTGMRPVENEWQAWTNTRGLMRVRSDSTLYIDSLKHSYAYLQPHALRLLNEIGHRFRDTLKARGGGEYRLKVTSLLRTAQTVGRLRRVNRNATGWSAHCYATTFDISYTKFICDDKDGTRRTFEDLKNLLAEILWQLRSEGRCVVKIERKQACFHITAVATDDDINAFKQ